MRLLPPQNLQDGHPTGPARKRWLTAVLWLLAFTTAPAAEVPTVVEVRALYLYNFSLFITWPESAFSSPDAPIGYCVEGNARLRKMLGKLLDGETAHGRPLRLIENPGRSGWSECHLLYLNSTLGEKAGEIRRIVQGRPVLLVSDSQEFVREGGMVSLVRKGRRVRPVINLEVVKASGIRISSKLLRLSTLVSTDDGDNPR